VIGKLVCNQNNKLKENSCQERLEKLEQFMDIPFIEALVGDDWGQMFFDTGAKLSYINPELTDKFPSVGTSQDFYPGIGETTMV
jgi:hypothetical protein